MRNVVKPAQPGSNGRQIRLVSTDFDGTLFAEFEDPPIPPEIEELIGGLQAAGAKWAINTGRDMSSLMEALGRAGIGIEPDFLVLVEREIHVHEDSRYVPLEEWNNACAREHGILFERVRRDVPRLVTWIQNRFHACIYEDPYSPLCLIAGTNGDMDEIHAHLDGYAQEVPGLTVVRNDVYARFSHNSFNKGTALAELSRRMEIGPELVFAAGDHLNDLPMLSRRYAHHLAAPCNAVPAVQEAIRREQGYLSARSHGYGIAEALRHYLGQS